MNNNKTENENVPVGRPSTYSDELAKKICQKIVEGYTIRQIAKLDGFPASSTIFLWLLDEDKTYFSEQYNKAKSIQADAMVEEIIEIADDGTNDWQDRMLQNGEIIEVSDHEHISRSRLRVDTRKWYASKVLPKKYGDKLDITSKDKALQVGGAEVIIINDSKK